MNLITPSIIKLQVVGGSTDEYTSATTTGGALTLSDHSRSPLTIDYEVIESALRMADGTMRRQIISKKKIFSCSWTSLPTITTMVADSKANAGLVRDFYEKYCYKPMTLSLFHYRNGRASESLYKEEHSVFWTYFNYEIVKRYKNYDYWDVSAEFTEI